MFNPKAKMFKDQAVISPSWISNGHFAIRKDATEPRIAASFASVETVTAVYGDRAKREMTDAEVEKCIPSGIRKAFYASPWILAQRGFSKAPPMLRMYETEDRSERAFFNVDYLDALEKPEILYGPSAESAFVGQASDDNETVVTFILMPARGPKTVEHFPPQVAQSA